MRAYKVRVFIPVVYEIHAENTREAAQKAVELFKREDKQVRLAFLANQWSDPEVEVEPY